MTATTVCENKLRWQSRRGVLELDLILDEFWRRAGAQSAEELQALSELLALDDGDLWRRINDDEAGRQDDDSVMRRVVARLQSL